MERLLIPTTPAISWTVKRWLFVIDVRRLAAIIKVVDPLFNLSDPIASSPKAF
jgi:hypothetical protein